MNKNEKILSKMLENYKHINEGLETEIEEIGTSLKKDNKHLLNWYAWFALEYVIDKIIIYKENIYN